MASMFVNIEVNNTNVTDSSTPQSPTFFSTDVALIIYGLLVFGSVVMSTGRNVLLYKICKNSSYNIHNLMINCILKAPMRFFDINPSGMIFLNDFF